MSDEYPKTGRGTVVRRIGMMDGRPCMVVRAWDEAHSGDSEPIIPGPVVAVAEGRGARDKTVEEVLAGMSTNRVIQIEQADWYAQQVDGRVQIHTTTIPDPGLDNTVTEG